jgi:hypothetical protein
MIPDTYLILKLANLLAIRATMAISLRYSIQKPVKLLDLGILPSGRVTITMD